MDHARLAAIACKHARDKHARDMKMRAIGSLLHSHLRKWGAAAVLACAAAAAFAGGAAQGLPTVILGSGKQLPVLDAVVALGMAASKTEAFKVATHNPAIMSDPNNAPVVDMLKHPGASGGSILTWRWRRGRIRPGSSPRGSGSVCPPASS